MKNIFLFTGGHHQGLQEKLKLWKQEFIKKYTETNLEIFDELDQKNTARLLMALESEPFLAEKRMVIIQGFPNDSEALVEIIPKVPSTTLLIFVSEQVDKRTNLYKMLSKHAEIFEFPIPSEKELKSWTEREFQQKGKKINSDTVDLLLLFCGYDFHKLHGEIEKLLLLEREEILAKDIEHFVSPSPEAKIFKALENLGRVEAAELLKTWEKLFKSEEDPIFVFFMMVRQFRFLLQIRSLKDKKQAPQQIQKRLRLAPFQTNLFLRQAELFPLKKLQEIYEALARIDYEVKTGKIPLTAGQNTLFLLRIDHLLCSIYE